MNANTQYDPVPFGDTKLGTYLGYGFMVLCATGALLLLNWLAPNSWLVKSPDVNHIHLTVPTNAVTTTK